MLTTLPIILTKVYNLRSNDEAHAINPTIVMILNGMNGSLSAIMDETRRKGLLKSWKGLYAGRPIKYGDTYFIDVFSREFNRDIAPMKNGYTDNYYYQMTAHIRRFKGMEKPPVRPAMQTIDLNDNFTQWNSLPLMFWDPTGDTAHRDFEGTDRKTRYTNTSGRNDIVAAKTVHDPHYVYFYVQTAEPLSPHTDKNWMLLFINTDQVNLTGLEGYDLFINRTDRTINKASIEAWSDLEQRWYYLDQTHRTQEGNQLALKVPVRYFYSKKSNIGFDFKWADNPQHLNDISAFFLNGDAAPDRRFNYRY